MASTEIEQRLAQVENTLSDRIDRLEEQVSQLVQRVNGAPQTRETAWWKKIVGVFQDDPEFEQAMKLGRAYRESLRPKDVEVTEGISGCTCAIPQSRRDDR
jgi:hypothetical protein